MKKQGAQVTKKDVYEIITERIVSMLEAGTVPWRKTWRTGSGSGFAAPMNLKSGKAYRGVNVFILACQGYGSPYWVTFNQAKALGGSVRKGQKGTPCVFWNWIVRDAKPGERAGKDGKVRIPFLRYFTVFNVAQCDGLTVPDATAVPAPGPAEAIDAAEAIVRGMPNAPAIGYHGDRAFYSPAHDSITVPTRDAFESPAAFYATVFHEMGHSTGHADRLDRKGVAQPSYFGSHEYSQEELVAEMTAAFLCAESGIEAATIENSAAYIASWLQSLKNDPKMLVMAAAQAQKAADYILDRGHDDAADSESDT